MLKRLLLALLLLPGIANAQFVNGQVLTAAQLNNAFANTLQLSGGILTGPLTVPSLSVTGSPIGLASGGTGATTQGAALTNLLGSSTIPIASGGTNASNATAAISNLGLRAIVTSSPTYYVDGSLGTDSPICGLTTGAGACKTIQGAYQSIAINFDLKGVPPTIQLATGQTFTAGLTIQQGQNTSPLMAGVNQLDLDLHGATISTTNNSGIYVRDFPIWLRILSSSGQGTITVGGSAGNLVDARGPTMVEFAGGINFGSVPGTYPQLSASRGAVISTCPASTCPSAGPYNITGGGGTFASAIIGGSTQLEGVTININSGITYQVAFTQADDAGSSSNWSGLTFTGSNVTGPQFIASKGGIVNTNAQTGSFAACAGNSYLPGSACGQMGFVGGRMDNPGTPTASGCGTGAVVQNSEPGFLINLGSGMTYTSGTKVSACNVTFSTRSNWTACTAQPNDPGTFANFATTITGPTSTAPGSINLAWIAQGYDPNGKTVYVNCASGP